MAETQTWRIDTGDRVREVVVTSVHRGLWRCEDGPRETSPVAAVRAYAHFDGCGGMAVAPGEPTRGEVVAQLAAVTAERDALAALRPRDPHRTGHRCACCGREGAPGADDVCPWCSDGMATMRERDVLRAQLATATASVQQLRADVELATAQRDAEACRADSMEGEIDSLRAQLAAVTAERDGLRAERDGEHDLIARQAAILTAVADALKGPPPALSSHSHHDLGAVAAATVAQQAPLVACVDALRSAARDAGWRDADATGETLVAWVRRGAMQSRG